MQARILPLRELRGIIQCLYNVVEGKSAVSCPAVERQLSSKAASASQFSSSSKWPLLSFPILGIAAAASAWALSKYYVTREEFHLLPLNVRQRIFFKYEKRIRDQSSLDKVFEYFSSIEKDGLEYLTPDDMLCAVVPTYPPSESNLDRLGKLDGERRSNETTRSSWNKNQASFLVQFDVDGDGLISFPEFLMLLTLLSIPGHDVKTVFEVVDLDGNGYIDQDEFKVVMQLLGNMARVHSSMVGRSKKLSVDDANAGLLVKFFGKDGKKELYLPEFHDFLDKLHAELVSLEFAHYDWKDQGTITAVDFGRSLIATADIQHVDRLLDKVDSMRSEVARERISLEEFKAVHGLKRNIQMLAVALEFLWRVERTLSRDDFSKLLTRLLGISLSHRVLEIIFTVFDDGDGGLDVPAFLETMQRRGVMWARCKNTEAGRVPSISLIRPLAPILSWLQARFPDLGVHQESGAS